MSQDGVSLRDRQALEEDEARAFLDDASAVGRDVRLGPINHIALNVTDLRRSEPWYSQALGLVRVDGEVGGNGRGHVVLASYRWVDALAHRRCVARG